MLIEVQYDGKYPNLCAGELVVTVSGKIWKFPYGCLSSGGTCGFDEHWNEEVTTGEWSIMTWPEDFPESLKDAVVVAVNTRIEHGCCGGCI